MLKRYFEQTLMYCLFLEWAENKYAKDEWNQYFNTLGKETIDMYSLYKSIKSKSRAECAAIVKKAKSANNNT